ncbi:MAG TPA: AAA family ATPase, partial [Kofleriaceae bacterium]|nr:AAA family ATPase [Kofleriaceae bacterium]
MLRKLTLSGFRGFSELELDLQQVTAIVGRNSSGKTSVLHAIRLVCDVIGSLVEDEATTTSPTAQKERGVIVLCRDTVVPDPARFLALSDWREVFTNAEVGEGVTLDIKLTFQEPDLIQQASLALAYGRNAQLKMSVTLHSRRAWDAVAALPVKSKFRPQRLREELQRIRPQCVFVPAFYGVTITEEYRTQPVVSRLLGGGDQSHIVRN